MATKSPISGRLTNDAAVKKVFGITLSKHNNLRTAVNSLIRNETIDGESDAPKGGSGSRGSQFIKANQLAVLHNALVLQALFPVKTVKKIIKDKPPFKDRRHYTSILRMLLLDRQSIAEVSLLRTEVISFINMLESDVDLSATRLPMPFIELPQIVLKDSMSVIQAILAQTCTLSEGDSMLAHYLNGDIKSAYDEAQKLSTQNVTLLQFKALVEREYQDRQELYKLREDLF